MTCPPDPPALEFPVVNLHTARFECTFGRGCEGACCRNGRPPVYPHEAERIHAVLDIVADRLRPEVRASVLAQGFLSRRQAAGAPMMRVASGWCVFFNRGCVLHALGAEHGDSYRYKPSACALFPLAKDRRDRWTVRQRGLDGEVWDLPCLDPKASDVPAATSLRHEVQLAQHLSRQERDASQATAMRAAAERAPVPAPISPEPACSTDEGCAIGAGRYSGAVCVRAVGDDRKPEHEEDTACSATS